MAEYDVVLDRVTKRFGNVVAVDEVSLAVERGEFLSIIGPSGCGKTTTLRMIAGLETVTSGTITIAGRRMENVPPYERNTALVFQNFALFPHMTVQKNVEFGLKMRGLPAAERAEKARRMLQMVGLVGLEERHPGQLSGGQKQRVGLARALATEPKVLLLDEPLGSLDARLRIDMQSELKEIQRQLGITFIHVTHNQSEALAMANRIVVMSEGRIEQIGTPEEIYATPRTRFVAEFVGKNNLFEGEVVAVEGDLVTLATPVGRLRCTTATSGPPRNARATCVVRADLVHPVVEGGEPYDNVVSGVLRGLEYVGSTVTLVVAIEGGNELKLEQHESLTRHLAPRHGELMQVGWRARDAHLLPG